MLLQDPDSKLVFDDYEEEDEQHIAEGGCTHFALVCEEHSCKGYVNDDYPGEGTCSVKGCKNEAEYYIGFNGEKVKR